MYAIRSYYVVTSLAYERLLCAPGPYAGELRRATDPKHPHKVAWIHCVGSRQVIPGGKSYCSAVCCTYTQKQVILTKDHDADTECTVFHNDIRSFGKDFERFYQRAEKLPGVRFIRSYVSIGRDVITSYSIHYTKLYDEITASFNREDHKDLGVFPFPWRSWRSLWFSS